MEACKELVNLLWIRLARFKREKGEEITIHAQLITKTEFLFYYDRKIIRYKTQKISFKNFSSIARSTFRGSARQQIENINKNITEKSKTQRKRMFQKYFYTFCIRSPFEFVHY